MSHYFSASPEMLLIFFVFQEILSTPAGLEPTNNELQWKGSESFPVITGTGRAAVDLMR